MGSFIFLRFRSGTRIPHPVSPSRSIQEILNIFRYFLIRVHFDKSELMKHFMKCKCFFAVSDGMLLSAIAEEVF